MTHFATLCLFSVAYLLLTFLVMYCLAKKDSETNYTPWIQPPRYSTFDECFNPKFRLWFGGMIGTVIMVVIFALKDLVSKNEMVQFVFVIMFFASVISALSSTMACIEKCR